MASLREPEVREVVSEGETRSTYPVMRQLRPRLTEDGYLEAVTRMRGGGYRLAAVTEGERVRCVAGFRVQESLHAGRHLYVDDLVTAEDARSGGHGKMMLDWLTEEARSNGCGQLHLDSGVQRSAAHRFYFREGLGITSFHFVKEV